MTPGGRRRSGRIRLSVFTRGKINEICMARRGGGPHPERSPVLATEFHRTTATGKCAPARRARTAEVWPTCAAAGRHVAQGSGRFHRLGVRRAASAAHDGLRAERGSVRQFTGRQHHYRASRREQRRSDCGEREERVRASRANDQTIDRPALAPFEQLGADGLQLLTPLRGPRWPASHSGRS